MKKFLASLLALTMAFGLVACGSNPDSSSADSSSSTSGSDMPTIDYSAGLTEDGYFEDVDLGKLVQLPDNYMSLPVAAADVEPTEEEWSYYLSSIAAQAGTKNTAEDDAQAQMGQFVSVDFSGSVNGEEFAGGSGQGVEIQLGAGNFLEDLENGIVGHKSGDIFNVEVTFPEGYGTTTGVEDESEIDLGGQTAVFSVILNSIYDYEITDEQIATYFSTAGMLPEGESITNEAELREFFNTNMRASKLETAILEKLKAETEFDVPQSVIDAYVQVELDIAEVNAYNTGRELDELLNLSGYASLEEFEKYVAEAAQADLESQCILLAVAQAEGLEVTDEACLEAYGYNMNDLVTLYGYSESYVRQNVLCYEALGLLRDTAVVA